MPIKLPELDNKSYDDLMKEMIASIPKYSKEWTNFNPSDPGITLLELLAWVTEGLIYRTNQVPEDSYINFLKLVAGQEIYDKEDISHQKLRMYLDEIATGVEKPEILAMKTAAQEFLSSRYTAVTEEDCRSLVLEKYQDVATVDIFEKLETLPAGIQFPSSIKISYDAIKHIITFTGIMTESEKNALLLLSSDPLYQKAIEALFQNPPVKIERVKVQPTNYTLDVIIIPEGDEDQQANFETTIVRVRDFLTMRRLLGSFINVQKAQYTDLDLLVNLSCESYAKSASFGKWTSYASSQLQANSGNVEDITARCLFSYLSKITGGPDGAGWPYGRNLVVYELFHELEKIENVKYVEWISQFLFFLPNVYPAPDKQPQPINDRYSSDYSDAQFTDSYTISQLCTTIENANYILPIQAQSHTLGWLNELLRVNGLYYQVLLGHPGKEPTDNLKNLKAAFDADGSIQNLMDLNRFLLEEYFPQKTPKSMKSAFSAMGYKLSDKAAIRLMDDSTWEITDTDSFYTLKINDKELKIYSPFTELAVDGLIRLNSLLITITAKGA